MNNTLKYAVDTVKGFIDDHWEDRHKSHISTYLSQNEFTSIAYLVGYIRDSNMEYPKELYENDYACKFSRNNAVLLGFMLNTSTYSNVGFDCDGKNYLPVFILEEEGSLFVEEDPYNNSKLPKYVVFFKGCDDASYGLRFKSREDRDQFLKDHQVFTEFVRTKCLLSN